MYFVSRLFFDHWCVIARVTNKSSAFKIANDYLNQGAYVQIKYFPSFTEVVK